MINNVLLKTEPFMR